MTRNAILAAVLLGVGMATAPASPALAQTNGDKTRTDDFAPPPAPQGVEVGQLTQANSVVATDQAVERTLPSTTVDRADSRRPTVQVSITGDRQGLSQVSTAGDHSTQAVPALSQRKDGRPTQVERLEGHDSCDPQIDRKDANVDCQRIVELRADEFSAPQRPRLSPEQELLGRQDRMAQMSAATVAAQGSLRPLSNADERAVQELGFVFLPKERPAEAPPEEEAGSGTLSEALKGVLVQLGVTDPG